MEFTTITVVTVVVVPPIIDDITQAYAWKIVDLRFLGRCYRQAMSEVTIWLIVQPLRTPSRPTPRESKSWIFDTNLVGGGWDRTTPPSPVCTIRFYRLQSNDSKTFIKILKNYFSSKANWGQNPLDNSTYVLL